MAEPSLQLRLAQKLALSPQLQQAIRLLQLNRIELREYIQEVLDANPLLEREEGDSPGESPELEQPADSGALAEDSATDWEMDTLPGEQWTDTPSYEGYSGEAQIADRHEEATVLFADIVGFTERSAKMPPEQLIELLNRAFTRFDHLVDAYSLEKIKTIGDAYMVVGGLTPDPVDHAERVADMALEMVQALAAARFEKRLVRLLVVPRAIARTGLHRREDVNQAGVLTALLEDRRGRLWIGVAVVAVLLAADRALSECLDLMGVPVPDRM